MESPLIYSNLPATIKQNIDNIGLGQGNAVETSFITEPYESGNTNNDAIAFAYWESGTGFTYEIPDCLMHRDFIEVHGVCLGKQITFELCTKEGQTKSIPEVIPLQVILNTTGQVTVLSRNKQKVEKQELFMKNCIRENMNFELCVYAYEDKYEIFLNKEKICAQKHMVELPEVFALSMDGDAEFLSVEFKDLYWEDEAGSSKLDEDVPSGFVRVQEMRESARNKKGEQVMVPVRNSFRSSQQSKTGMKTGLNNEVSTWQTSADLSKPYLDEDYVMTKPPAQQTPATYSSEVKPMSGPQMYATLPSYGSQQNSSYDPNWSAGRGTMDVGASPASKSRISMGGSRKSITLNDEKPDRLSIGGDIHQGNYRPIDDQDHILRSSTMASGSLITASTPSLQEKSKKKRFSLLSKHRKSKGSEPDIRTSVQQDMGSDVKLRKSRGSAFDVRPKEDDETKKKKKFHFKNIFKRKKSRDSVEITPPSSGSVTLSNRPSYQKEVYENPHPIVPIGVVSPKNVIEQPKDLLKRPSAEMAAYMHDTNSYPNQNETTLTGKSTSDLGFKLRRSSQDVRSPVISKGPVNNDQVMSPQTPTRSVIATTGAAVRSSSPIKVGKLKGSAPEMAAILYSHHPNKYEPETTLTEITYRVPMEQRSTSIKIDSEYAQPPTTISTTTVTTKPVAPTKLKGNAPEIASQILSNHPRFDDDNTYYTNLSGVGLSADKKSPDYKRNISIDRDLENPVFNPKPSPVLPIETPNYAYSKNLQKTRQAVSLPDYQSDEENNLSEGSTVYTDGEYYLEVGKSAYYFERKRSLKNYRSRRSVKQEKAARRQMGLATGDSDSALSSISSLKPDDPTMTPRMSRRRVGAGTKEVKSWLDSQSPDYGREQKVIPTAASTRVVYADAPPIQLDQIDRYSTKDICETFQNKDLVEFPVPLIPGRQAYISGSFVNLIEENIPTGLIRLSCTQEGDVKEGLCKDLYIEILSNGHLELFTKCGSEKQIIHSSSKINAQIRSISDEGHFCLCLTNQHLYFAVTRDNWYTLMIPKSILSFSPRAVEVEEPRSIKLDRLLVSKCLTVPLNMHLPPESRGYHHLELITKLTADSEEISFKYLSEAEKQDPELSVIMDMVQYKVYISFEVESAIRIQPADIPFIPEQIKSVDLILSEEMDDCSMKVKLNGHEILTTIVGPANLVNQLTRVHVDGDFQIADAQLTTTQ